VTARPLLLIGGGEHAGVVAEAAATDRGRWRIVGYTDPRPDLGPLASTRAPRLGDDSAGLARFDAEPSDDHPTLVLAVGGVGDPGGRRRVSHTVEGLAAWARWATIVHATAWVSPSAELSDGTVVLAGVIVNAGASVGRHGIVNTRAVVEHDVRIGEFVHLGPGAIIGGGARIGSDVTIGMGALIRDHVTVGDGATIGMGAVVVADVPPGVTVVGSPARPLAAPATSDVRA
jgi:sugar O-acyltransferase (sialic acid O-acetyltransferase NeuD family)